MLKDQNKGEGPVIMWELIGLFERVDTAAVDVRQKWKGDVPNVGS